MAGVPIPSYSSAVSSLPRLRGDGMDSDVLKNKAITPLSGSPPNPPPPRHKNLNSSARGATVARTQKPRHVPREPIKGAVGQLTGVPTEQRKVSAYKTEPPGGGQVRGHTQVTHARIPSKLPDDHFSSQSTTKPAGNVNKTNSQSPRKQLYEYSYQSWMSIGKSSGYSGKQNTFSSNVNIVNKDQGNAPPYQNPLLDNIVPVNQDKIFFSPVTLNDNGRSTTIDSSKAYDRVERSNRDQNKAFDSVKLQNRMTNLKTGDENHVKFAIGETRINIEGRGVEGQGERSSEVVTKDDFVISLPPPEEERQVEGQSRGSEDLTKLQNQVGSLSIELQQQVKVNTDLKKLLVASVGDDLHWKMDALVQTKTQLGTEICDYTKQIEKDYEQLDQLSIQADMWRSKFMATRVLIDQLASDKESLSSRWREAERALKQLMSERQTLHETMVESHRYLKLLRDSFDPVFARKTESIVPNILELARTNLLLAEAVKFKLLGSLPVLSVALDAGIQNGLTPAEKIAYQVLMDCMEPSSAAPGRLSAQKMLHFGRFHPHVRYEGITCTHCRNCKGEIQVV